MNNFSRIKTELLKSGLPLESMIADAIKTLSSKSNNRLINHGEYLFERQESEFPNSVDFLVTYDLDIKDADFMQIAFLIECKYRTRGTSWYFTPSPMDDFGMEFFVRNYFSKGKCEKFPTLAPPLNDESIQAVGKGIEIYSNGARNEKSISEGIHQLMFASSSLLSRAFVKEETMLQTMLKRGIDIRGRSCHSLICPILLTTSDIYFLKDVNIEKIEKSERPEDLGKAEKIVSYSTPKPPLYIQRYIEEVVFKDIMTLLANQIDPQNVQEFLYQKMLLFPSRYYIVNSQSFKGFMEKYIHFAGAMLSFACKKTE
jgi:hypothetical protein